MSAIEWAQIVAPGTCIAWWARRTRRLRMHVDHHPMWENVLDFGVPMRDALLVHVAQELLQCRPVLLDTEREWVAVEHLAHAPRVGRHPGDRVARDRLLDEAREAA